MILSVTENLLVRPVDVDYARPIESPQDEQVLADETDPERHEAEPLAVEQVFCRHRATNCLRSGQ